jgi:hypothetical protein
MLSRQDAILGAARSARRFATANEAALTSVDLTAALKRLDEVITSFTTHAYDQDSHNRSAKGETEKQRQLRLKLRSEQMAPIAEIARQNFSTVPEFKALQMPPRSAKGQAFLVSAQAMIDAASKYNDALLERGLPADSLEQFQALLTTFATSVGDRKQKRDQRMGATKGLAFEEKEARSVLKMFDGLVRRALDGNAALLGQWNAARTIYYRTGGATKTTVPTTAPAPTTPAAPIEAPASDSTPTVPATAAA